MQQNLTDRMATSTTMKENCQIQLQVGAAMSSSPMILNANSVSPVSPEESAIGMDDDLHALEQSG